MFIFSINFCISRPVKTYLVIVGKIKHQNSGRCCPVASYQIGALDRDNIRWNFVEENNLVANIVTNVNKII